MDGMKEIMPEQDPTKELVERARGGDRRAFCDLVAPYAGRLRLSIENWSRFRLGSNLSGEEILQDTFVRAFKGLGRFEWQGEDSFFRWLCGIAKHALAQAAQDARRAGFCAAGESLQEVRPSPSQNLRRHERFDRLETALEKLSSQHRQVILLCRIEGLTSAQAAVRMNRSPASIRQLLVRALRDLKKIFGDTESFHLPDRQFRFKEEGHGE